MDHYVIDDLPITASVLFSFLIGQKVFLFYRSAATNLPFLANMQCLKISVLISLASNEKTERWVRERVFIVDLTCFVDVPQH